MNNQEILEYNKRCAEFLGWKIVDGIITWIPEENEFQHEVGYSAKGFLKFHSDWNWIMEIVEAINKTQNSKQGGDTTHSTLKREVQALLGKAAKEAVVQAINQFLIWYNEQKSKHEVQTD
mgnify:CR=1